MEHENNEIWNHYRHPQQPDSPARRTELANDIGDDLPKLSFLMVHTATQTAYCREDGVWVVPLGCLRN